MPPDSTPSTDAGEVSRLRAELYDAQTKLAEITAAKGKAFKSEAIASALAAHPLAEGSAEQLSRLFENEVTLTADERGVTQAVGPGLTPLNQHISSRLAEPAFRKFLTGQPAGPVQRGPHEPLHEYLTRQHAAKTATDPRMDMSRPFGLGRASDVRRHDVWQDDGKLRR